MYKELAKFYDLLYQWKDYEKESQFIHELIQSHMKTKGKSLLDVGCGTAEHLRYLKNHYECTGIDLNESMLQVARQKLPDIEFVQADMVNFNLKQEFDVIISLFSSIGYVQTYENLKKAMRHMSGHLKKGGVLIIEPWLSPDEFDQGRPYMHTYEENNLKIARLSTSKIQGDLSILDMHYLIAKRGEVAHYTSEEKLGLFDTDRTLDYMQDTQLASQFLKEGLMDKRGLMIGIKQ